MKTNKIKMNEKMKQTSFIWLKSDHKCKYEGISIHQGDDPFVEQ